MFHPTLILAAEAAEAGEKAGLFDFDATLPFIAIQFLILAAILNAVYFQPVTKTIDGRGDYVRTTLADARDRSQQAERLAKQYDESLGQARLRSQQLIAEAEASAMKVRTQRLMEAQAEVKQKMDLSWQSIEQEKQQAQAQLGQQVGTLGQQILSKILGSVG